MRIELDRLEGDRTAFAHRYGPGELIIEEEQARLTEPPEVRGRLTRKGREVGLSGTVTARAEVDCDRCLRPISVPLSADFDVKYISSEDYEAGQAAELQAEDLSFSVFRDGAIDVDELVREQVLLALPTRALCREECKGLCPACGADMNEQPCGCGMRETDPRWEALKNLLP
jgi:uncharacterized protein